MRERAPLNLTTSPEAHDGWRTFVAAHGTNMTALAEAIGLALADLDDPEGELPPFMRDVLRRARLVAADRVSRRP